MDEQPDRKATSADVDTSTMHKTGLRAVAAADAAQLTIPRIDERRKPSLKVVPKTAKESEKFGLQGMEVREQILDLLLGQDIAETAHLAPP